MRFFALIILALAACGTPDQNQKKDALATQDFGMNLIGDEYGNDAAAQSAYIPIAADLKVFPDAISWDGRLGFSFNLIEGNGDVPFKAKMMAQPIRMAGGEVAADGSISLLKMFSNVDAHGNRIGDPRVDIVDDDGHPLILERDFLGHSQDSQIFVAQNPLSATKQQGNPYRCSERGYPERSIECYDLVIFWPLKLNLEVHQAIVQVKVHAFSDAGLSRLAEPRIISAKFILPVGRIRPRPNASPTPGVTDPASLVYLTRITSPSGEPVHGGELSSTADARLLFMMDRKFTFNASEDFAPNQWTPVQSIFNLHEVPDSTKIQGVPFKRAYPLAQRPLLDTLGNPCTPVSCPMIYIWVDQDGSELFFNQTINRDGAYRGSFSIAGARTGFRSVVVDSALNRDRMEGVARSHSFGLFPSMWAVFPEWHPRTGILPLDKGQMVYTVISRANRKYGEINLTPLMDRNYLVYLPMNEFVRPRTAADFAPIVCRRQPNDPPNCVRDIESVACPSPTGNPNTCPLRLLQRVDINRPATDNIRIRRDATPDVSGNFANARLEGGAQFPREALQLAARPWPVNEIAGFRGKGIFFSDTGTVTIPVEDRQSDLNPNATDSLRRPLTQATWQLAVKLLRAPSGNLGIGAQGDRWQMTLNEAREVVFKLRLQNTTGSPKSFEYRTGLRLMDINRWYHIAIRMYDNGSNGLRLDASLHSDVLEKFAATLDLDSATALVESSRDVVIGPPSLEPSRTPSPGFVYMLDEFAISDVARDWSEIRRSARYRGPASATAVGIDEPFHRGDGNSYTIAGTNLPASIRDALNAPGSIYDQRDLHIPDDVAFNSILAGKFSAYEAIGRKLYSDGAVGGHGISCVTCHSPNAAFTDPRTINGEKPPMSTGVAPMRRNTPTNANRIFSVRQTFDGRAGSLAVVPWAAILDAHEIAGNQDEALAYIRSSAEYRQLFTDHFAVNLDWIDNTRLHDEVARALTSYVLTQILPPSLSDRIDSGMYSAEHLPPNVSKDKFTAIAHGRTLFFGKARCASCHYGRNFTDEFYHNDGTAGGSIEDIAKDCPSRLDCGRYTTTKRLADLGAFKTPTLRHIKDTNPYFHDGSIKTLEEVVRHYNGGIGRPPFIGTLANEIHPLALTDVEQQALVEYLNAL